MARDEFSARNGTLSINQQTLTQRAKTGQRFSVTDGDLVKELGVGSSNSNSLFAKSPIGYDDVIPDRQGGSLYNEGISNVYQAYAKVIDKDEAVDQGFGFSNGEKAHMNYNHPDNPFKEGDRINYNALTLGEPMDNVKAYKGFPDLVAGDLDSPSLEQEVPTPGLIQAPDGATYGHTTSEYRKDTAEILGLLGKHVDAETPGNGDSDTLGKYFTKNVVGE